MERVAFLMRAKEGYEEEYVRRHKDVWPAVLADLQRSGVQKMSIFMRGRDLFLYMEVDDYAEVTRILSNASESVKWEEYMAPIMENAEGDDYDPDNAYPDGLPEVFYWESSDNS